MELQQVFEDLGAQDDYTRGVREVLGLLGLVSAQGEPRGPVARMMLAVLRAHLRDGVPVQGAWNELGGGGVALLRWVEQARLAAIPQPTPARVASAVELVAKARFDGVDHYLMQWDDHAGRYQPLGGKIDPEDPSPEDALRRELFEELRLKAVPGPALVAVDLLETSFAETSLSATYGILTAYTFRFYHARRIQLSLPLDNDNRWLSVADLRRGAAPDDRPVTDLLHKAFGEEGLAGLPLTALG